MALSRSGSFRASLRPFGGGSSDFSAYDIGATLAEYNAAEVEMRWRNGAATDAEYEAVLRAAVDATTPNTEGWLRATDRLDDAVYRMGRSRAEEQGLDELIAFDQAALARMNPESVRYRDVSQSLESELASRRSRDYGRLVDDYNEGRTSTTSLLDWVTRTVASLDPEDRDFENWSGVQSDLTERLSTERDSDVYQDYQAGRMKPAAFLAYLTTRRDSFTTGSPKRDEWDRRLEDAARQVKDSAQNKADQAFFNSHEQGKVSDKAYLAYLRNRIAGMDADDPSKGEWQHRLHQGAFSLAEDQLRFDVEKGKAPASRLISFYRSYRGTLNPGSAEWRQITRSLDVLARSGLGGGRGRGRGGGGGGGSTLAGVGGALPNPKVIGGKHTPAVVLSLMTVSPYATGKGKKVATEFFDLNFTSLENARQRGDKDWLFYDPRYPNATVAALNPDGSPVLDAKGKPVMVRGSGYIPVEDQLFADLNGKKAEYRYGLAEIALARHDFAGYADNLRQALNAQDRARLVESQYVQRSNQQYFDLASDGIEAAVKIGDYATAVNVSRDVNARLRDELANPMLDDTRRDRLNALSDKLGDNPLIPKIDPFTGQLTAGAIDVESSTLNRDGSFALVALNPGWHHVLDRTSTATGEGDWGLVFDPRQDGSWEAGHRTVHTAYGDRLVSGEVTISKASTNLKVRANYGEGMVEVPVGPGASFFSFVDEHGQLVRSYSLDGQTWIRALPGELAPVVAIAGDLRRFSDADGTFLVDAAGEKVFAEVGPESWAPVESYLQANPGSLSWFGQREYEAKVAKAGRGHDPRLDRRAGLRRSLTGIALTQAKWDAQQLAVGAPGFHMQMATTSPSGAINMLPSVLETPISKAESDAYGKAMWGAIGKPVTDLLGVRWALASTKNSRGGGLGEEPKPKPDSPRDYFGGTLATLRAQLPADTPPRYEGISFAPVLPPPLKVLEPFIHALLPSLAPIVPPVIKPLAPTRNTGGGGLGKLPPRPRPQPAKKPSGSGIVRVAPTQNTGGGGMGKPLDRRAKDDVYVAPKPPPRKKTGLRAS